MVTTVFLVIVVVLAAVLVAVVARQKYHNGQLEANLANARRQIEDERRRHQSEINNLKAQQREQMDMQREQTMQQLRLMKEEMNSVSEKILHTRQQQLAEANTEQLSKIVSPLHDELKRMQQVVERADREHTKNMVALNASIKSNLDQAEAVGRKADKLAQALTGENKTQGNFGELRLKQLLDDMGFQEGLQYEQQVTLRDQQGRTINDSEGHRLQPDVVLHFPENRDIIIDSKISLTAFEEYFNTDDEVQKRDALRRHVQSLRNHVNELSRKDYAQFLNGNKLDVVIMYVFSESALQLALSADATLYKEAYDKRVIICGSNNLYALLRVLEASWKQMRQVQNQQEIVKAANSIVERAQMFYERILKVEDQLRLTQKAFDDVKTITASKGRSIVVAANQLKKYGASESARHKSLPDADFLIEDGNE